MVFSVACSEEQDLGQDQAKGTSIKMRVWESPTGLSSATFSGGPTVEALSKLNNRSTALHAKKISVEVIYASKRPHKLYVHAEQPQENLSTEPNSRGMCICSGQGLKSSRFHSALIKFERPSFTHRRRSRKKQADGTFKTVDLAPSEKDRQATLATHRLMLREA